MAKWDTWTPLKSPCPSCRGKCYAQYTEAPKLLIHAECSRCGLKYPEGKIISIHSENQN